MERATRADFYSAPNPYRYLVRVDLASSVDIRTSPDVDTSSRGDKDIGVVMQPRAIANLHWPPVWFLVDHYTVIDEHIGPKLYLVTEKFCSGRNKPSRVEIGKEMALKVGRDP
jgi:hypothetical protein